MREAEAEDVVPELPALVDASRVRETPTTARGVRTRAALVATAREVFERDGFINSRLVDITAGANCSIGTFYTYFDSKEEIFTAVMQAAAEDMLHPGLPRVDDDLSNVAAILEASNRAYVGAYKRNARLNLLLEQVATIDPEFRKLRLERGRAFAERNARWIKRLQDAGYANPALDSYMTARALSPILGRMAYHMFALEEPGMSEEAIVATATRVWLDALGVPLDGSKRSGPDSAQSKPTKRATSSTD
ncbi:TetR/AcrR family transcriptional regulator [Aeromicrobium senzhongii]|uniref:TetR/AcrR family transcriptional regulator n=1 Tax=Aeromicrobium senzhongii TaxID=2663859 RepID=A0ABX6ST78_9ACTN|nr:TetR/AcrR family transcriptional regulator [Aeromicrobium senzhongii]MTB89608.1 TetR family transcriptional regulator [Aeromicrobium senzhongii]QNL94266.1 TetR/AcrR family transcriptional regulator [Aeromicrobium senzhongii]